MDAVDLISKKMQPEVESEFFKMCGKAKWKFRASDLIYWRIAALLAPSSSYVIITYRQHTELDSDLLRVHMFLNWDKSPARGLTCAPYLVACMLACLTILVTIPPRHPTKVMRHQYINHKLNVIIRRPKVDQMPRLVMWVTRLKV